MEMELGQAGSATAEDSGDLLGGGLSDTPPTAASLSVHEIRRVAKGTEISAQAIENRIKHFKREEEKIWRDLEEVRRQAAKIEEGRIRNREKKLASEVILQVKEQNELENRVRVRRQKEDAEHQRKHLTAEAQKERRLAGDKQRKEAQEILRRKRLEEAQARLSKSERVVAIQREQLEAKLRTNQERAERILHMRQTQELERLEAAQTVTEAESRIPDLEAEEISCLQRLQNSRIIRQTVLQELEASLGSQSAVAAMLRSKTMQSLRSPQPDSPEAIPETAEVAP